MLRRRKQVGRTHFRLIFAETWEVKLWGMLVELVGPMKAYETAP